MLHQVLIKMTAVATIPNTAHQCFLTFLSFVDTCHKFLRSHSPYFEYLADVKIIIRAPIF